MSGTDAGTLSVIIPVYNEESTVGELLDLVLAAPTGELRKEIVVVDDGSTDASPGIIQGKASDSPGSMKVHLSIVNLGKGAAIRFGLKYATGDIFLIQDADLELDPGEYPALLEPVLSGRTRVIYGSRFLRPNPRIPRRTRLANAFLTWVTNLLYGTRLTDMATAYKVFRREALEGIELRCVGFEFEPEITAKLARKGERILEVPISYSPRRPDEGKKIGWPDGLKYLYTLLRYRAWRPAVTAGSRRPGSVRRA